VEETEEVDKCKFCLKTFHWTQAQSLPWAGTRNCWVHAPENKTWRADYIGSDKIQNSEITQTNFTLVCCQVMLFTMLRQCVLMKISGN